MAHIIFFLVAFFCGSIPCGLLYGFARGVDIRKGGSGNIGATNVSRTFGFWQGFVPILILDMLKGVIPLFIYKMMQNPNDFQLIIVGIAAILGHIFSPWLSFKGGKGVATAGGVFLFMAPIPTTIALVIFMVIFFVMGKVVGKASVAAVICYPFILWLVPDTSWTLRIVSLFLLVLIVYTHRSNIKSWFVSHDNT
ncbi:MAG: glycerol-3-phosphate 1-O-acyltransferase PlsY [Brevinema sp.]